MAKRGAEDQLTREQEEAGGRDRDDEGDEETGKPREASADQLAKRQIRGMPKRGGAKPAPTAAATPGSTFSFGAPGAAPATSSPFTFGAPPSSSTPTPVPAPASTSNFSFGAAAPSSSALPAATPKPAFGGFSFGATAPDTTPAASTSKPAFGGFSFGAPPATSTSNTSTPLSFGSAKPPASTEKADESAAPAAAPASKPFGTFSFGSGGATASSSTPAASSTNGTSASSSGGFSFGQPSVTAKPSETATKAATPFSFGTPAASTTSTTSQAPKAPTPFSFGAPPAKPTPAQSETAKPSTPFQFGAPPSSASTSKPASFGAPPSKPADDSTKAPSAPFTSGQQPAPAPAPAPAKEAPTANGKRETSSSDDKQVEYLKNVRGLNESLVRAINAQLRADPFTDLGAVLSQLKGDYEQHLAGFRKDAGIKAPQSKQDDGMQVDERPAPKAAPAPAPISAPVAAPPKVGAFSLPSATPAPSSSSTGGFKPTLPAASSSSGGFSFGAVAKPASSSTAEPAQTSSSTPSIGLGRPSEPAKSSTSAGRFVQNLLNEKQDKPKETAAAEPSMFAIKPTVKPGSGESMVVPSPPTKTNAQPFVFGAAKTFSLGSDGGAQTSAVPTAGNTPTSTSFGSPARPRNMSTGFAFGKSSPDTSEAKKDAAPANGASASPFSFGSKPAASPFAFGAPSGPSSPFTFGSVATSSPAATPAPAATSSSAPTEGEGEDSAPKDAQVDLTSGSGEEDEVTVWEGRVAIREFAKQENGSMGWSSNMIGVFKLKREKGDGDAKKLARRVLVRQDPGGRVLFNFALSAMIAFSKRSASQYTIRIAEPTGAKELMLSFGKKSDSNDPEAKATAMKNAIASERSAQGLSELKDS